MSTIKKQIAKFQAYINKRSSGVHRISRRAAREILIDLGLIPKPCARRRQKVEPETPAIVGKPFPTETPVSRILRKMENL